MPSLNHSIEVACSAEQLFGYITQPWRWHEWHPNSRGATASEEELAVGDSFFEEFEIRPVGWLPIRIRRTFHYRVIDAEPPLRWEIRAEVVGGDGEIHFVYDFEPMDQGSRFTRRLDYQIRGPLRVLAPLLRRANARMSEIAMARLKERADQLATGDR